MNSYIKYNQCRREKVPSLHDVFENDKNLNFFQLQKKDCNMGYRTDINHLTAFKVPYSF